MLLYEGIYDNDGQTGRDNGSHLESGAGNGDVHVDLRPVGCHKQAADNHLQRIQLGIGYIEDCRKEHIPVAHQVEQAHRHQHRQRQRQCQPHQYSHFPCPIDFGRFVQLLRQVLEEGFDHKHVKG
ncbi:hypothetical protein D3C76_1539280 [compost metagenome]